MWGWIISILIILVGILALRNSSTTFTFFEDGAVEKKKDTSGCLIILVGLIWLGIKIFKLF